MTTLKLEANFNVIYIYIKLFQYVISIKLLIRCCAFPQCFVFTVFYVICRYCVSQFRVAATFSSAH